MNAEVSLNAADMFSYEVDAFNQVCGVTRGGQTQLQLTRADGGVGVQFDDLFLDNSTRQLFVSVLHHVRQSSETVSFPFRCDSSTHTVYQRCIVFLSSSRRVAVMNRLIGKDRRPVGIEWDRKNITPENADAADFVCCSLCSRLNTPGSRWVDFQQLVDERRWPASGRTMICTTDVCGDCVKAIEQRIAETLRSQELKTRR